MDSATLLQQLKDTQASTPSASDLYNQASAKYGLPEIRSQVSGLRTTLANTNAAINNVAPSVAARSQGSLVTGGQQSALANLERQPLDKAYATENTALGNANSDLTSKLGEATNEANLGYKTGQDKVSGIKDLLSVATQREQAAEAKAQADRSFAESQRQFNATPHGSSGSSKTTSAPSMNDYYTLIADVVKNKEAGSDNGYGAVAKYLNDNGHNIVRNSPADQALRKYFGFDWQAK